LGGTPADSNDIAVTAPDVAENGRNVPVSVTTSLSEVQAIYVLVESNPFPFAAAFSIPEGTDANISVRLKLAQSGKVIGIVRAANELFWASRYVQVTVGGCA
jgi:sulfur-oxidizing protein SoxY